MLLLAAHPSALGVACQALCSIGERPKGSYAENSVRNMAAAPSCRSAASSSFERNRACLVSHVSWDLHVLTCFSQLVGRVHAGLSMPDLPSKTVLREFAILAERSVGVRQLKGRPKNFRWSTTDWDSRQRQLAQWAEDDLEQEIDRLFSQLRSRFELKRRDITVTGPHLGTASLATPSLDIEISLLADADDAETATWRWAITRIREPEVLTSHSLDGLLDIPPNKIAIELDLPLDLEAIIDYIEDHPESELAVDYDRNATWCEVSLPNSPLLVRIDDESIVAASRSSLAIDQLLAAWVDFQRRFSAALPVDGA